MSLFFHWPPGGRTELIGVSSGMRSARVSWFDQEYRSSIRRRLHQEYLEVAGEKYTHWEYDILTIYIQILYSCIKTYVVNVGFFVLAILVSLFGQNNSTPQHTTTVFIPEDAFPPFTCYLQFFFVPHQLVGDTATASVGHCPSAMHTSTSNTSADSSGKSTF